MSLPKYLALKHTSLKEGHWTTIISAKYCSILPDNDKVLTLQMLSTKMILQSNKKRQRNTKATTQIGMQVPGPLQKITSGLNVYTTGMVCKVEYRVLNIEVIYDCCTFLLLGIRQTVYSTPFSIDLCTFISLLVSLSANMYKCGWYLRLSSFLIDVTFPLYDHPIQYIK